MSLSHVKRFLKLWTPPILIDAYRWLSAGKPQRSTEAPPKALLWEGIYQHYRDVPASGKGYEGTVWIESRTQTTRSLSLGARHFGAIPPVIESRYNLLAFLASVLSGPLKRVRVLDFGGAMGIAYVHLCTSMQRCESIDYYLVDNASSCRAAADIFAGDPRIHLHSQLDPDIPDVHIAFMSGVLQYIDDYSDALRRLVQYKPRYLLITLVPIVNTATFASAQVNLRGSVMPAWFFNLNDIVEAMKRHGYSLLFTGSAEPEFDTCNFPEESRITHMANLLFAPRSAASVP